LTDTPDDTPTPPRVPTDSYTVWEITTQPVQCRDHLLTMTTISAPAARPAAASTLYQSITTLPMLASSANGQVRPNLPPASTFDFIPPLHEMVSRVLAESANPSTASVVPETSASMYSNQQGLAISQLAAEVSTIKDRLRKARAALVALPDLDQDLEEQEQEMQELRARIDMQKQVLRRMSAA